MDPELRARMLERVRKLLERAKDISSPMEASQAASMAQDILARYNLDVADVPGAPPEDSTTEKVIVERASRDRWMRSLLHGCARATGCYAVALVTGPNSKTTVVYGRAHEIAVAEFLYRYLAATVGRLSLEAFAARDKGIAIQSQHVWVTNFRMQAVLALNRRLLDKYQEQMDTPESIALVVNRMAIVKHEAEVDLGDGLKSLPSKVGFTGSQGRIEGHQAANSIQLNDAVGGARREAKPLLGTQPVGQLRLGSGR